MAISTKKHTAKFRKIKHIAPGNLIEVCTMYDQHSKFNRVSISRVTPNDMWRVKMYTGHVSLKDPEHPDNWELVKLVRCTEKQAIKMACDLHHILAS